MEMEMEDPAELLKSLGAEIDENRENLRAGWPDGVWLQPCICRVPWELSDLQKSAYCPRAVCIGPLHRDEYCGYESPDWAKFEAMEVTKLQYMVRLFARRQNQDWQECVAAMLRIEERAQRCYTQQLQSNSWSSQQFGRAEIAELNPRVRAGAQVVTEGASGVRPNPEIQHNPLSEAVETLKATLHYIQKTTGDVDMAFQPSAQREKVEFAKTMLIDGCFIIELVYRRYKRQSNDPILSDHFKFSAVKHDLLLLGNQIPFFVLQELFDRTLAKIDAEALPSLPSLIISFFKELIKAKTGKDKAVPEKKEDHHRVHHILHLLHQHHLPMPSTSNPSTNTEDYRNCDCILQICCAKGEQDQPIIEGQLKHSATDLHLAGVKFVAATKEEDLFRLQLNTLSRLRLWRRGRFEIPPFSIKDSTETLLRNLIAMEQCFPDLENYFTSHAFLMDKLINTPEDVKLLENAGIIRNYLGSPEEVANIFNTICKNVNIHPFKFQELCVQLNHYSNSWWPRRLAKLKRDYFASPWSAIAFIAAIMLFVLTLLQTIYTMLSFY